ncbi:unnamed protein product [Hymenolepis diminuta]|uniref:N-acetyltransferase domain-containing protein n=1 Tax=Hymenolepis diminuta TaxID=6216 RepID=A0A158QES9_HYMDI|nr:unnamed protein product [Hymenolepis diminuta]
MCYILTHSGNDEQNFGECFEVEPLCILDFYVSTDFQRQGFGKELFEFMLREENLDATDLPIDSPSPKMLAFMRKHFNQTHPLRQSNNFVIFPAFFQHVNRFLVPRRSIVRNYYSLVNDIQQSYSMSRFSEGNCQKPKNVQSITANEEIPIELSNSVSIDQNSSNKFSSDDNLTKLKMENMLTDTSKEIGPPGNMNFNHSKSVRKLDFDSCTSWKSDSDNAMQPSNRQEGRSNPAACYAKRLE